MTTLSDGDWRRVEKAYRDNTETVDEIARRFGVAASTIRRRRKMENWPSRAGGRGQPGDGRSPSPSSLLAVAPASRLPPERTEPQEATAAAGRGEVIRRFYHLIEIKLEQMEVDMARREDRTPADNERDTRALGTLIRNFEKVFGLEREQVSDGDTTGAGGKRERDEQAEAEALRRELAERLVRLRNANHGAGGRSGGGAR